MRMPALWAAALIWALTVPLPTAAQTSAPDEEGLLVVYGALAPSREGDVDRREQIFFSVPADLSDRIYVRIFDPETSGSSDFIYGGIGNASTTYRIFGGDGAWSEADRPRQVQDGDRAAPAPRKVAEITGPGKSLREKEFRNDKSTDGRWVALGSVRARQGEIIDDRAYFRLDIQGTGGDDGNGYSVGVSLARDRALPPEELELFSYNPTIRWPGNGPATQVWFTRKTPGPHTVQNFDGARGELFLATRYDDLPLKTSGQDVWAVDSVLSEETNLALSLSGGFEKPNDVTLAVFDGAGQPVGLDMPPRLAPEPPRPTAIGTARPLADCSSVAFDGSASTSEKILSYLWEFGDGNTSDEPAVAHRFARPGRYDVKLGVLEEGFRPARGDQIVLPVHVRPAPVAIPGENVTVAPGELLTFDGTSSRPSDSPITGYSWTFGDGSAAQGEITEKAYTQPGVYRAVLRVSDDSQHPCDFGVATRVVTVNFPPVAEAGTDISGIVGAQVVVSAADSYDLDGLINSYTWDMGDGTLLQGANVSHTYQTAGTYQAVLTVTDDSGVANATSRDRMIIKINAPPRPAIAEQARPLAVGEATVLDGTASIDEDGAIVSYLWDFGDGAMGEGASVEYAWTQPGVYRVGLTVVDDSGTASAVQSTSRDVVVSAAPVANAGPDVFVTASEVLFDGGRSSDADGAITSWEWDFGDGTTATGPSVTHAYVRPGTYKVALVVRDDSGAPLNVDRDVATVEINARPIADAGPALTVAPGQEFVLDGGASVDGDGRVTDWVWTFPDGTTTRGERVSKIFETPGLKRVLLSVADDFEGGAASDEAEVLITVNSQPVAVAGADLLVEPGQSVTFDASDSYDIDGELTAFRWEFDDLGAPLDGALIERAYMTPGVWSAQLFVTDDSGVLNATASDDRTIRVNHEPVAEAGPEITTDQLIVTLDGAASSDADGDALIYAWDLGDGSDVIYGETITHAYPRSGTYPVTLRVNDGTGLGNAGSIDATKVIINARPVADAGGNRDVCSGQPILFDASDSVDPDGGLLLYSWDFGDGSDADIINPSKTYELPGTYPVTLTVRNETGLETGTDTDRIAAIIREGPIADAGKDRTVCTNQQVRFDGSGSSDADGAVNEFAWNFGDGGTASGEQPVYIFKRPGTYEVVLTITGEAIAACSPLDTDTAQITVVAAPEQVIAGFERAGAGLPATFTAELTELGGAEPISYAWSFSDGGSAEGPEATHVFEEPGEYLITLTTQLAGGNAGCSTIETLRKVVVNDAPKPLIEGPLIVAAGDAVVFDGGNSTDSDGAITTFEWDFGDGGNAGGVLGTHRFAEPGTYTVALTVTDDAGVGNSVAVAEQQVVVNPAPVVNLAAPAPVCIGEAVPWTVRASDSTEVVWSFGDGSSASGREASHAYAAPGLYPVSAALNDGRGLANSARTEEVYVRVNAPPTALAGPDRTVCPGEPVRFEAGASGDLDGEIVEWLWEFSDGVVLEGASVERVFDTPGPRDVLLTVRDDSGATCATGKDLASVLVNSAPRIDAGPDVAQKVGAAHDDIRFDASGAYDEDGHGIRVSWDFGDGSKSTGAVVRHRYAAPGDYTITVTAQDSTGLVCGASTDTSVVRALPRE